MIFSDYADHVAYVQNFINQSKYQYKIFDCLGITQTLSNNSINFESVSNDDERIIILVNNYFVGRPAHKYLLTDLMNKFKES